MTRILLVEDQELISSALAALLDLEDDFEVVGRAPDGREALRQLEGLEVDVVVTDVEMPHMSGLDLAGAMRTRFPAVKVVMLTTFARVGYLQRAMESGADAYLLKDGPTRSLSAAIRGVMAGANLAFTTGASVDEKVSLRSSRSCSVSRLAS